MFCFGKLVEDLEGEIRGLGKRFGVLEDEIGDFRGRVEETHIETQKGFADIKSMLMALKEGGTGKGQESAPP